MIDTSQLQQTFADVESVFNDLDYTEPLTAFQQVLADGERDAFASQQTPGGEAWAALAASTVKKKGHAVILFETGKLRDSLSTVGGPGNINAVSERGSLFGTDVEYSLFHTTGTKRMPQREHVGTNDAAVDRLAASVADYAVEQLRAT